MEFSDIREAAERFRMDRNWKQFHNPKDLAISISIEASELLECFQWSAGDCDVSSKRDHMSEELADVMLYCLYFAESIGIDPLQAMAEKIKINEEKYPVFKSYGSSRKYSEL